MLMLVFKLNCKQLVDVINVFQTLCYNKTIKINLYKGGQRERYIRLINI